MEKIKTKLNYKLAIFRLYLYVVRYDPLSCKELNGELGYIDVTGVQNTTRIKIAGSVMCVFM